MTKYPNIEHALSTAFSVDLALPEDKAIAMYVRSASSGNRLDALKCELRLAFNDPALTWVAMLANEQYEAYYADTESEARKHALRILWQPIFGNE
jgi:hypothetical protein